MKMLSNTRPLPSIEITSTSALSAGGQRKASAGWQKETSVQTSQTILLFDFDRAGWG
jgi:hypothetical protein